MTSIVTIAALIALTSILAGAEHVRSEQVAPGVICKQTERTQTCRAMTFVEGMVGR